MKDLFEVTNGTTIGKEHRWDVRNNQDGSCCYISDEMLIAVVCDGCSESQHSEVGAQIGARLLVNAIFQTINTFFQNPKFPVKFPIRNSSEIQSSSFWWILKENVLENIKNISEKIENNAGQTIKDFFVFTIVGALLFREQAVFFSFGDGIIAVNGEIQKIGPFEDNEPPYIAYGLVKNSFATKHSDLMQFQIHKSLPVGEVQSFLIGTDGVTDLIESAGKKMPGKNELVGPLSQFWEKDDYFKNPDSVRRKLSLVNREIVKINQTEVSLERETGHLKDDTTIIVGRRKKGG